jgi:uncharacterized protein
MDGLLGAEKWSPRSLEQRLSRRRAAEAEHHKGRRAHGHGDFLLWHDRVMAFVLRTALQFTGLYQQGLANALRPEIHHLRLEFPELPLSLDGFRILHLADLHIDGMDGLAETLAARVAALPVDLCVLTGDYRFEVYGPCDEVYRRMRRVLGAIRARHGVVGILGNHDSAEIASSSRSSGYGC